MKLAFVNPPQPFLVDPCVYPPVGLCALVASVKKHRPTVGCELLDLAGHTQEQALKILRPFDVVGYTAQTATWNSALALAKANREQDHIIGGAHVTITRETDPVFRSTFYGFADLSILDFIDHWKDGVARKTYESISYEMDDLPFPYKPYGKKLNAGGADRTAVVFTSRGCTDKCAFCAARAVQKKIRYRSIPHVLEELEQIKDDGITEIRFMDDAFTMSKPRVMEVCNRIAPMGFRWACMIRADQVDSELLGAMRESGCREVAVGIESFDPRVLQILGKRATVVENVECVLKAHEALLGCHIFLMIGTPGETYKNTVDLNIAMLEALKGKYHRMLLSTFMPHPGCPIHDKPKAYGCEIIEPDTSRYNQHHFLKVDGVVQEVDAWSPIRIDGMTYEQQTENIQRMREYALETGTMNKGVLK